MEQPPADDEERRRRATLMGLAAAILIIVVSVWALSEYKKSSDLLDCIAAGHKNCQPIEIPPQP